VLNRSHRKARILFALSDILLLTLAFAAAYQMRLWLPAFVPFRFEFYIVGPVQALFLGFTWTAWLLLGVWYQIYDRLETGTLRSFLRDTTNQCVNAGVSLVLFEYLLRLDLSRLFLALFLAFSWILLCLFRLNAGNVAGWIRREFGSPLNVLIVGTGEGSRAVAREIEAIQENSVKLIGFLSPENAHGSLELDRSYPVHPLASLASLLRGGVVDEIVFAVNSNELDSLKDVFLLCDEEGIRTRVAMDFFPHINSKVSLETIGDTPVLTFSATPTDEVRLLAKRAIDIVIASAALVVLFPLMVLIAAIIKATSSGPAIFAQKRCGLNGRLFTFYKFRSMCENAEDLKPYLSHLNKKQTAFKIPDDPRLTPIGRWLRKFSIDEWPQLWNVLRGDMSIVGPRPAVPDEVANYQQWQRRRLRMRPGLTCLWTLAGRDTVDFETWMRLDLQYIDSWSLALDWKIILMTIPHVLTGRGAS
jgi:exopolysaccharide biosynthesis polyprenyl glycosylphosphotransferase